MLHKTRGIVLRPVKYGDTSIVVTIFTEAYGVQAYMVRGVRVSSKGSNKAAYFQPGTLLDVVVYMQPSKNIQQLREYQASCLFLNVHQDIVRNSILLFSVELLLRLLPNEAPIPSLFSYAWQYFCEIDEANVEGLGSYPLLFLVHITSMLGYDLTGTYCSETPYLNVLEGGFSAHPPSGPPYATKEDAVVLSQLLSRITEEIPPMNGEQRVRLIDWYIAFLQQHSQHMGNIRSLQVLRTVLHA
jgi:DNA repair protein RecO (recombination protein O)